MRIKKSKIVAMVLAGVMTLSALTGCGSSSSSDESASSDNVLRVGMECAYAPFNWTQDTTELANGETAVPIYGTNTYAYGYDVMVAKKLADEMGMELEVHKVEWDSIGMSLDAGEYDCIIAGMGRTAEREASYSFTDPYYYRDNCLVVKAGGDLDDVKGLSDLAGKNVTVTTQLGTGWVNLLDQIPDVTLGANYETTSECFMAITNGVADVCVIDVPTAESAAMTNSDLKIIYLDSSDKFEGDEEMTNVCIATRKDDTELRDKLQSAMDSIGWNDKTVMDETMETAISLQPAAN
jgi:putative lysine transport system substrate-binding protein